jgi:hypothetical protein
MFMNRSLNIAFSCVVAAALIGTAAAAVAADPDAAAALGWPGLSAQAKPAQTAKPTQTTKPTMSQMGATMANLGSVRIPRAVKADGQALPAGTYQIRVTQTPASPAAAGQTPQFERWAEFLQGGQVRGREVVTIVPPSDISQVADMKPPPSGSQRVEVLKGGDYLRLWLNRGGTHYLIHFNI